MRISAVMSTEVKIASPKQSIQDAALMMAEIDAGVIPVAEGDRLVGMITDRDIAVRAVAAGKPPQTPIADVMSSDVKYCFDSDNTDAVAKNMADIKLRRLPVLNSEKRLVGIVSLADIAVDEGPENAGRALSGISEPGGEHSQSGGHNIKFIGLPRAHAGGNFSPKTTGPHHLGAVLARGGRLDMRLNGHKSNVLVRSQFQKCLRHRTASQQKIFLDKSRRQ